MNNLFIIHETYTNGYRTDILDVISLFAILCGMLELSVKILSKHVLWDKLSNSGDPLKLLIPSSSRKAISG